MNTQIRKILIAAVAVISASCGGGGSDAGPAPVVTPEKPAPKMDSLLIIGNSITRGDINPTINWLNDWGAVASAKDKDFAHIVSAKLGLPLTIVSGVPNERDASAPIPVVTVTPQTVVVVELGDNGLPARYPEIIASVRGAGRLVCTSTWWRAPDRDAVMRSACEAAGGTFVDIGDLFHGRLGLYENEALDSHPGDAGMSAIASRIVAAVKE